MLLNDLPADLTARIVSCLAELETTDSHFPSSPKTSISRYAGTSMNVRDAIEQRTFSTLSITSDDLPAFEELVARSRSRQALLCDLTFQPVLPAYSELACTQYETPTDEARNNDAFSASIRRLFAALVTSDGNRGAKPLRLCLLAPYSPTDLAYRDQAIGISGALFNARFAHSYLSLDLATELPILNRVSQFVAANDGPRYMAPGPIFSLLRNMPRVEDLVLRLSDNEKKSQDLRKQLRIDFSEALCSSRCSKIKRLRLDYVFETPLDHRFTSNNMRVRDACTRAKYDPFGLALRQFISSCPSLVEVQLSGPICVDETLFWSADLGTDRDLWLNLKHFSVDLSCVRTDGSWYLCEHRGFPRDKAHRRHPMASPSDDSDGESLCGGVDPTLGGTFMPFEDEGSPVTRTFSRHKEAFRIGDAYILSLRSEPSEELEQIWTATALAAAAMPKLCSMSVGMRVSECPRTDHQPQWFGFRYDAKDNPHFVTGITAPIAKLHWTAPNGWTMSEELERLWRKGLGPVGEATYEHW